MGIPRVRSRRAAWVILLVLGAAGPVAAEEGPRTLDPRLVVEPFATAPGIVHPIALDFDNRGRLLVVESHTHFRPEGYPGPAADRVRIVEDTDGDGKADRFGTFFEGTRFTMDVAAHPDGSVYLATRNEVLRLRDTDGDGKADERRRVAFLDTVGTYPHNGLSGLAFDSDGSLIFGMGENLGADYSLVGGDGTTIRGGGEGGNVFRCAADGSALRRIATGLWNPFGACRDIFGRVFAVDNDPDALPPCRVLHVVEGGDYGYQYRYGRAGRHVFHAWNGELPGTLPMISGTGEAPCEVLSYESDGMPDDYRGNLLVTSWADHRIERYVLKERGASFVAEMQPVVRGGTDFRPVGLAVAPDGSLFLSDWVLRSYNLHNRGAIWHLRAKNSPRHERPGDPERVLVGRHRPTREAAARRLAGDEAGRATLRRQAGSDDARVRAASLTALIDAGDRRVDLRPVAEKDPEVGLRALAVRALAARGEDVSRFLDAGQHPQVVLEAIGALKTKADVPRLRTFLDSPDPFLQTAAVRQLSRVPGLLDAVDFRAPASVRQRIGLLLAARASGAAGASRLVPGFLADADEDVRFLAAKWVADDRLSEFRPLVVKALDDRGLNVRMFSAFATALARIDGREVDVTRMADAFFDRLADDRSPPALRVMALRLVPATYPRLKLDLLSRLLTQDDASLRLEAARALCEHPDPRRSKVLLDAARNESLGVDVRAQAIVGLAERAEEHRDDLLRFALGDDAALRDEALRSLVNTPLTAEQRTSLEELARRHPDAAPLAARVLGAPFAKDRPALRDVDAWLARLDGPADVATGRRVFFQPKLAGCFRCHMAEGRGRGVGPDLGTIGRTERRHILESILQPSNEVGPSFQNWLIETADGKLASGMLVRTDLDEYTYLDAKGGLFKLRTTDIVERRPSAESVMPTGLPDLMTDRELRDLLAYLQSRR